ncbi:hypothetical protein BJF79_17910 [Actinomadura sp. CNU-125]|uniref:hypothetical protein n=1 Tax=Actinomadura sp. CNU-125 TaxID=1904961 RepID=UPI00095EF46E|nr:hypothetical protein [Actinomadura sp. CNU-125]OLT17427.1 hypothetical protein BJF79_17910 [Actinomadura sp. CNU-125]
MGWRPPTSLAMAAQSGSGIVPIAALSAASHFSRRPSGQVRRGSGGSRPRTTGLTGRFHGGAVIQAGRSPGPASGTSRADAAAIGSTTARTSSGRSAASSAGFARTCPSRSPGASRPSAAASRRAARTGNRRIASISAPRACLSSRRSRSSRNASSAGSTAIAP